MYRIPIMPATQRNVNKIPEYNLAYHFSQMCAWICVFVYTSTYKIRNFTFRCLPFDWSGFVWASVLIYKRDNIQIYIMWTLFFSAHSPVSLAHRHVRCGIFPILDLRVVENAIECMPQYRLLFPYQHFISFSVSYLRHIPSVYAFCHCCCFQRHLDIMNREHCVLLLLLRCSHLDYT